ncbi:hypothetical protein [Erwinia tasmaniensis]
MQFGRPVLNQVIELFAAGEVFPELGTDLRYLLLALRFRGI